MAFGEHLHSKRMTTGLLSILEPVVNLPSDLFTRAEDTGKHYLRMKANKTVTQRISGSPAHMRLRERKGTFKWPALP